MMAFKDEKDVDGNITQEICYAYVILKSYTFASTALIPFFPWLNAAA